MNTANSGIMELTKYASAPGDAGTSRGRDTGRSIPMRDHRTPNSTTESIPYGYCHCGCGEKTRIATRTYSKKGIRKGEPLRYISGHQYCVPPRAPIYDHGKDCFRIPLTRGLFALVDAEDVGRVSRYNWIANADGKNPSAYYAQRRAREDGPKSYAKMHRMILDAPEGMQVDHVNGDTLDNRRSNLRIATPGENRCNAVYVRGNNSSGYTGVTQNTGSNKWIARIGVDKRRTRLGSFACPIEAAIARDVAALELHGEFASLNFPHLREVLGGIQ